MTFRKFFSLDQAKEIIKKMRKEEGLLKYELQKEATGYSIAIFNTHEKLGSIYSEPVVFIDGVDCGITIDFYMDQCEELTTNISTKSSNIIN